MYILMSYLKSMSWFALIVFTFLSFSLWAGVNLKNGNFYVSYTDIVVPGGGKNLKITRTLHIKKYLKDHRVFMMSCIAALSFGGNWKIDDKDSINTSFPIFLKILKSLGAKIR